MVANWAGENIGRASRKFSETEPKVCGTTDPATVFLEKFHHAGQGYAIR